MNRTGVVLAIVCQTWVAEAAETPPGLGWLPDAAEPVVGPTGTPRESPAGVDAWLSTRFEGHRRRTGLYAAGELGGLFTVEAGATEGTTGHDFGLLLSRAFPAANLAAVLAAAQSHQVLRLSDGEADFSRIAEDRGTLTAALGYIPSPELRVSAPLVLSVRSFAPAEGFAPPYARPGDFAAPADDETLAAGVSLRWHQQSPGQLGPTGAAAASDLLYQVAHSGYAGPGQPPAHSFRFQARAAHDWSFVTAEGRLTYGFVTNGDPREATRLGGGPGLRGILPDSIWCERHVAGGVDLLVPFARWAGAAFGAGAFGDAGRVNLADERQVDFYTAGAEVRVARARDAAPLFTALAGHNAPYSEFFFAVGLDLEVE